MSYPPEDILRFPQSIREPQRMRRRLTEVATCEQCQWVDGMVYCPIHGVREIDTKPGDKPYRRLEAIADAMCSMMQGSADA